MILALGVIPIAMAVALSIRMAPLTCDGKEYPLLTGLAFISVCSICRAGNSLVLSLSFILPLMYYLRLPILSLAHLNYRALLPLRHGQYLKKLFISVHKHLQQ